MERLLDLLNLPQHSHIQESLCILVFCFVSWILSWWKKKGYAFPARSVKARLHAAYSPHIKINDLLLSIKILLKANRVSLYRLSNGEFFLPNTQAYKVTCTAEKIDSGLRFESDRIQKRPAETMDDFLRVLLTGHTDKAGIRAVRGCTKSKNKCTTFSRELAIYHFNIRNISYSWFKSHMEDLETRHLFTVPVYQKGGIVGAVTIQYRDSTEPAIFKETLIMCELCGYIRQIQFALDEIPDEKS